MVLAMSYITSHFSPQQSPGKKGGEDRSLDVVLA